jgi:hypothetical protein
LVDQEEDQGDPVAQDAGSVDRGEEWDVPQLFVGTAACAGACAAG